MPIAAPYLMFLGDVPDALAAKTAYGVVDWRRDRCVGQLRLPGCRADAGLPDLGIAEAVGEIGNVCHVTGSRRDFVAAHKCSFSPNATQTARSTGDKPNLCHISILRHIITFFPR